MPDLLIRRQRGPKGELEIEQMVLPEGAHIVTESLQADVADACRGERRARGRLSNMQREWVDGLDEDEREYVASAIEGLRDATRL